MSNREVNVIDNRGHEKPAEPEPIIDISPKVVSDEEIEQFQALDKEIERVKQVFALAQQNAQVELTKISKKQTAVWKVLADKYGFDINDPWQVNYQDKIIVPGVDKVKGK
jgi:hypothetical protein